MFICILCTISAYFSGLDTNAASRWAQLQWLLETEHLRHPKPLRLRAKGSKGTNSEAKFAPKTRIVNNC